MTCNGNDNSPFGPWCVSLLELPVWPVFGNWLHLYHQDRGKLPDCYLLLIPNKGHELQDSKVISKVKVPDLNRVVAIIAIIEFSSRNF